MQFHKKNKLFEFHSEKLRFLEAMIELLHTLYINT